MQLIGLTRENPKISKLLQSKTISDYKNDECLLHIDWVKVMFSSKELCQLDFGTWDLHVGQSLGILLTRERDLHWCVDDKWRGVIHVDDYPLDRPMWGVADVFGRCVQVKAEICSGESLVLYV